MGATTACYFAGSCCSPMFSCSAKSRPPSSYYSNSTKPNLIESKTNIIALRKYETTRRYAVYEKSSSSRFNGAMTKMSHEHEQKQDEYTKEDDHHHIYSNDYKSTQDRKNHYQMAIDGEISTDDDRRKSLNDYFEEAKVLLESAGGGGGGPRWFSPLECGSRLDKSPLLLFLPGIDGLGLGLVGHHHTLGRIFDIWCLHIPVKDRTSFTGLVKLVEKTVRTENRRCPDRPIYLVGESLGACLALAVAAYNPDIDLVVILSNPATSFDKSPLQTLIPFLEIIPDYHRLILPYILSSMGGDPLKLAIENVAKGHPLQKAVGDLPWNVLSVTSYLPVMAEILPRETFLWKLQLLKTASASVNARLHAVKAQTLILSSAKDQFLPSEEESDRLSRTLSNSDSRQFSDRGHFLFLEEGIDLATIIKGVGLYRRGRNRDHVLDYVPTTTSEFKKIFEMHKLIIDTFSPVMFSTLEDGKVVKGLAGIPLEGPVLYVGYHMFMGLELAPLVIQILSEKNILVRGIAHNMMFRKSNGLAPGASSYDHFRLMGAVPVSATNFFKLMSTKSHALLYPGGVREACHRKGEEYQLFWPEQSEFVRMAARFGAKIVPFGTVGEDDIAEIVFDYNDQTKIPFLRDFIRNLNEDITNVRSETNGEVQNQDLNMPIFVPKNPGRIYYYFGKPIDMKGRKELRDRTAAQELYLQVKSEVEKCLAYLRAKREGDPHRYLLARLAYHATRGFNSPVPTFEP